MRPAACLALRLPYAGPGVEPGVEPGMEPGMEPGVGPALRMRPVGRSSCRPAVRRSALSKAYCADAHEPCRLRVLKTGSSLSPRSKCQPPELEDYPSAPMH